MRRYVVIAVAMAGLALGACSSDDGESCESICLAAQAADCTWIDDCYEFCDVTWHLSGKSDCRPEYHDYHDCAQSTATCSIDAVCGYEEDALLACAYPYCYANPNDPDCIIAMDW